MSPDLPQWTLFLPKHLWQPLNVLQKVLLVILENLKQKTKIISHTREISDEIFPTFTWGIHFVGGQFHTFWCTKRSSIFLKSYWQALARTNNGFDRVKSISFTSKRNAAICFALLQADVDSIARALYVATGYELFVIFWVFSNKIWPKINEKWD